MIISSELSAEEVLKNIKDNSDPPPQIFSLVSWYGTGGLISEIKGNRVQLHKRIYQRNSFCLDFYGEVIPKEKGCEIAGDFKLPLFSRVFIVIARVFSGVVSLMMCLAAAASFYKHKPWSSNEWNVTIGFILFFLVSLGFPAFAQGLYESPIPAITDFLNQCAKGLKK